MTSDPETPAPSTRRPSGETPASPRRAARGVRGAPPLRVGLMGCGNISGAYLGACGRFAALRVDAVADLDMDLARARAAEHRVPRAIEPEALLTDPDLDLIVNLTVPAAHAEVSLAAMRAGKAVYSEKPLATSREDGRRLLDAAEAHGVRLGAAPDTFLGGGLQTCRKLIDDGWIGRPLAATAFMVNHGMEHWHPNPAFFFQPGAGPLFDVGVYYLTALVTLLGPVARVSALAGTGSAQRIIGVGPRLGQAIEVGTPTHVSTLLEFENGAQGVLVASFDVWASELPRMEIYGTQGTLSAPDPNTFGGPVRLARGREGWGEVPLSHGYTGDTRGLGVADIAHALRSGRPHRAAAELAYHVLDIMQGALESAERGERVTLHSRCERPAPLPLGLAEGLLDD